ncbi:MAG: hypothetical protein ABWZ63_10610 [Thermoleophilaceae bacterium]
MSRSALVVLLALVALGAPACGDDDDSRSRPRAASAQPPPPPDAGTRAGHGADVSPTVKVPESDTSPPEATITLSAGGAPLGRASQPPGDRGEALVRPRRLSLRGTTVGRDPDGGVARVRVSIMERITCRRGGSDATFTRLRRRYFPPPQVERIRSTPGTVLPTRRVRSLELHLGGRRCGPEARPRVVHGEIWGEAVNGSGLEAVTPHVRFRAVAG